eukprot:766896-Hanusia_phi.AAC.6
MRTGNRDTMMIRPRNQGGGKYLCCRLFKHCVQLRQLEKISLTKVLKFPEPFEDLAISCQTFTCCLSSQTRLPAGALLAALQFIQSCSHLPAETSARQVIIHLYFSSLFSCCSSLLD